MTIRKRMRRMPYPTKEQVEAADREQLCRWYRFLPTTIDAGEEALLLRIIERFTSAGGFTTEISKKIGWTY